MTYTYGASRQAKAEAALEAAKLAETEAMAALVEQHTATLRRRYEQLALTTEEEFMQAAKRAKEWAETRYPETWETGQTRLHQSTHEAFTHPGRNHKPTERSVSNAVRSPLSRVDVAA